MCVVDARTERSATLKPDEDPAEVGLRFFKSCSTRGVKEMAVLRVGTVCA
jgi:hypothetical protein